MAFEERFYREELDYLRQLGKLLGREKPHLARFLAEKEGDPDVERLMEAFAFLSGGLRQKLEDEFPEFTHSLINMLWPNYLRPIPAMSVIEYQPGKELKSPVLVCRDELIKTLTGSSTQISTNGALSDEDNKVVQPACHFTLARDVWLQPLSVQDVRNASTLKEGIIEIDFFTEGNVSPGELDLNKLTFWLGNEDDYTRYQLYLWFSERLMDAELVAGEYCVSLPEMWLKSAGFERGMHCYLGQKTYIAATVCFRSISATRRAFSSFICREPYRYQQISQSPRLHCVCILICHYL